MLKYYILSNMVVFYILFLSFWCYKIVCLCNVLVVCCIKVYSCHRQGFGLVFWWIYL